MSPVKSAFCKRSFSFPRVSGDEPQCQKSRNTNEKFSPRERG